MVASHIQSKDTGRAHTVLVADSDPDCIAILRKRLEDAGNRVLEARDGGEALTILKERKPDAAVIGSVLPTMDGIAVCTEAQADSRSSPVPLLFIAENGGVDSRHEALRAGAADVVSGPVDAEEVLLRLRNLLKFSVELRELRAACERTSRLEALKDTLMHMIVHDMRAPLMVVEGYLDLLWEDIDGILNDESREYVGEAKSETSTLVRMVGTLYDIDAFEAGTAELYMEQSDLVATAEQALESLGPMYGLAEIRWARPEEPVLLEMDARCIGRVMANLVSHALRYTPEDGVVRIAMEQTDGDVRVCITDDASAIPAEFHDSIFDKFGQAEVWGDKKQYSTGLGLAFSRLAVEAHGGEIGISTPQGQSSGNTIWFHLPTTQSDV